MLATALARGLGSAAACSYVMGEYLTVRPVTSEIICDGREKLF